MNLSDVDKVAASARLRTDLEQRVWIAAMTAALQAWIPGSPRPEASAQAGKYADDALAQFRERWPA